MVDTGFPDPTLPPPGPVLALADGRPIEAVWRNGPGGLTFRIGSPPDEFFCKWAPAGTSFDLRAEAARLVWAGTYVAVPEVLDVADCETGSWLLTRGLPGENAITPSRCTRPDLAAEAIGAGLRAFHDALPIDDCPFSWSASSRVGSAHCRAAAGVLDRSWWDSDYRELSVADALALVHDAPDVDRLVVCHGDTCAPNFMLDDDWRCVGYVDLGALGVADRWADLAIATWSTTWNYGDGWEQAVLDAYGIEWDAERIDYYRVLWQLGP